MTMSSHLFCFGFGYSARYLSHYWAGKSRLVSGTQRNIDSLAPKRKNIYSYSRDHKLSEQLLQGVTHLLISIPPDKEGDIVLDHYYDFLSSLQSLEWVGYLSTTGIYGDHQGGVVDETTLPNPSQERSVRRLKAEQRWLELYHQSKVPVHIFRLAGIYGPGRSLFDDIARPTFKRVSHPGQIFSRIHVVDIARILMASIENPHPGEIYNLCDNEAAAPEDVSAYACQLASIPVPSIISLEEAQLSEIARSFWYDNKRVSNKKIREKFNLSLCYPTYREGLSAIWQGKDQIVEDFII